MPIPPHTHSDRTSRLAEMVLDHAIAQRLPWHATEALLAVSRGDPGIDPAAAQRLLHVALQAVVTAEIAAAREARP